MRFSTAARALVMFFPGFLLMMLPYLPPLSAMMAAGPWYLRCIYKLYAVTSIPMLRAVPFTLLMAASMEAAFRSGIFCLAMSATCFSVTLPTLSLFGEPEPLATPAARFSRIDAGGVLVMKVNDLSL